MNIKKIVPALLLGVTLLTTTAAVAMDPDIAAGTCPNLSGSKLAEIQEAFDSFEQTDSSLQANLSLKETSRMLSWLKTLSESGLALYTMEVDAANNLRINFSAIKSAPQDAQEKFNRIIGTNRPHNPVENNDPQNNQDAINACLNAWRSASEYFNVTTPLNEVNEYLSALTDYVSALKK